MTGCMCLCNIRFESTITHKSCERALENLEVLHNIALTTTGAAAQVVWALSVQAKRCSEAGVEYDAEEQTKSRSRRESSSVQNTSEGQGRHAAEVGCSWACRCLDCTADVMARFSGCCHLPCPAKCCKSRALPYLAEIDVSALMV